MKKPKKERDDGILCEIKLASGFVVGIAMPSVNDDLDNLVRALIGEIGLPAARNGKDGRDAVMDEIFRICDQLEAHQCITILKCLLIERHDLEAESLGSKVRAASAALN